MNIKLAIGIATTGGIKTKTFVSVMKLVKRNPENTFIIAWEGCNVHQARINIVKESQKYDCTHLLFIDSDMVFESDIAERLLARDKDIIGVNSMVRQLPLTSTVKIHNEKGEKIYEMLDDLFECQAVGTGIMLIKMSVFDKLPRPWFFYEQDENGDLKTGSDMWFCNKAKEVGFKIWCDPTINVGHIGDFVYGLQ